jgi:hypothetical protein
MTVGRGRGLLWRQAQPRLSRFRCARLELSPSQIRVRLMADVSRTSSIYYRPTWRRCHHERSVRRTSLPLECTTVIVNFSNESFKQCNTVLYMHPLHMRGETPGGATLQSTYAKFNSIQIRLIRLFERL